MMRVDEMLTTAGVTRSAMLANESWLRRKSARPGAAAGDGLGGLPAPPAGWFA